MAFIPQLLYSLLGHSNIQQGKLVKVAETNASIGITDPRDKDISSMSIASALHAHNTHHGSFDDRLHVWMAAGTPRGSPSSAHRSIGEACRTNAIGLTMHCAEAPKDLTIFHDSYSCSPVEFCQTNLLTGSTTVLAHMVHLDLEVDLALLKDSGTSVAHNPTSNCKLASGIARIPEMLDAGVNVSLGTDGAPCGNTYDMIREMHLASILHSGANCDATLLPATAVLEMATINGARALGLQDQIGSLEVGKKADFVVVSPGGLHAAPYDAGQLRDGGMDPVTVVVHSCSGADVDMVVVDGRVLVEGKALVGLDEEDIKREARRVVGRIRGASGVRSKPKQVWNYI